MPRFPYGAHGFLGVFALCLSACQSIPNAPLRSNESAAASAHRQALQTVDHFQLEAKLAVQYAGKGYTGRMQWQHSPEADHMDIFSPLGQQVASIERDAQQVTLTDQQGIQHQAQDVGTLTEKLLGWRLPLHGLSQWIRGIPDSSSPFQARYLESGEAQQLLQDGWQIDFDDYQPALINPSPPQVNITVTQPNYIRLQQGELRLKLVVLQRQ